MAKFKKIVLIMFFLVALISCTSTATIDSNKYGPFSGAVNVIPNCACMLSEIHTGIEKGEYSRVQGYLFEMPVISLLSIVDIGLSTVYDTIALPFYLSGKIRSDGYCSVSDCSCSNWSEYGFFDTFTGL